MALIISKWVSYISIWANRYLEDFSKNPNWEVSGVKHHVIQQISVDLSLSQMYRSRKAARGLITRNEESQYSLLRNYAKMIRMTDEKCDTTNRDGRRECTTQV